MEDNCICHHGAANRGRHYVNGALVVIAALILIELAQAVVNLASLAHAALSRVDWGRVVWSVNIVLWGVVFSVSTFGKVMAYINFRELPWEIRQLNRLRLFLWAAWMKWDVWRHRDRLKGMTWEQVQGLLDDGHHDGEAELDPEIVELYKYELHLLTERK